MLWERSEKVAEERQIPYLDSLGVFLQGRWDVEPRIWSLESSRLDPINVRFGASFGALVGEKHAIVS